MTSTSSMIATIVAVLLLVGSSSVQPVSAALDMMTLFTSCTDENDGFEVNSMWLVTPTCQPLGGGQSLAGSCSSGFKAFNNTNCEGTPVQELSFGCTTQFGSTARVECVAVEDPEFLRIRSYPRVGATPDCGSDKFMTVYLRLNHCYRGNPTSGFKYDKKNATAYFLTYYNDIGCTPNLVNDTVTLVANGICDSTAGTSHDFIRATAIGNTASQMQMSFVGTAFIMVATIAVTMLT